MADLSDISPALRGVSEIGLSAAGESNVSRQPSFFPRAISICEYLLSQKPISPLDIPL
jgi:hypothetical protein